MGHISLYRRSSGTGKRRLLTSPHFLRVLPRLFFFFYFFSSPSLLPTLVLLIHNPGCCMPLISTDFGLGLAFPGVFLPAARDSYPGLYVIPADSPVIKTKSVPDSDEFWVTVSAHHFSMCMHYKVISQLHVEIQDVLCGDVEKRNETMRREHLQEKTNGYALPDVETVHVWMDRGHRELNIGERMVDGPSSHVHSGFGRLADFVPQCACFLEHRTSWFSMFITSFVIFNNCDKMQKNEH